MSLTLLTALLSIQIAVSCNSDRNKYKIPTYIERQET